MSTKHFVVAILVDGVLLLALGCYFLFNKLAGQPHIRGFFCDDLTISYPTKKDTVSWVLCLIIAGLVPLFIIVILEVTLRFVKKVQEATASRFIQNLLVYVGPFIAGFFFEHTFVEIAKFNVGRLRPNFIDNCRPYFRIDGSIYDCHNTTKPNHYVGSYDCINHDYRESLLSFPSGHTSIITYAMVFAVGYLQMRMPRVQISFLLKPLLQIGLLLIAWYISLSRVSDHKHHWSDVLAGSLIGSSVALVSLYYVRKWSNRPEACVSEEAGLVTN